jgi:hypothetical protein
VGYGTLVPTKIQIRGCPFFTISSPIFHPLIQQPTIRIPPKQSVDHRKFFPNLCSKSSSFPGRFSPALVLCGLRKTVEGGLVTIRYQRFYPSHAELEEHLLRRLLDSIIIDAQSSVPVGRNAPSAIRLPERSYMVRGDSASLQRQELVNAVLCLIESHQTRDEKTC